MTSRHGVVAEGNTLFQMVMPKSMKSRLQDGADEEQVPKSEFVRRAIEDRLAALETAKAEAAPKPRKRRGQ